MDNTYREELVNEVKAQANADGSTLNEAFFDIYCQRLEEAEIIEDYQYTYFEGKGANNRNVQIDGYAYSKLDERLTLFIIPPLSYFDEKTLTRTDADANFSKAKNFYFDADRVVQNAEESSEGYGLARDIVDKRLVVHILELIILTDCVTSTQIGKIESTHENGVRIDYSIYDIQRMERMDRAATGKEAVIIDLKRDFGSDGIPVLPASKTDQYQAYLCNVPGELLVALYDRYQSRLLEGNVRSFLQTRGKVNKGIRNTILKEPEMFFAYNNGIAATAESMDVVSTDAGQKIVGFKSLQIVNGGQTTVSLASAWVNDANLHSHEQIAKIFVPMKVSVVTPEVAQTLIPKIARYANSQNKVSDADLASNHQFHQRIEDLSRNIVAPAIGGNQFGTYWYYERANGQYRQETYKGTRAERKKFETQNPKNQMFRKVDLAKYYNIYLQRPDIVSAGAQKSFSVFTEWMIKEWDKNQNFVNEEFFKKVVALYILFQKADYVVKGEYKSYKANIVAYALADIFHKVAQDYPDKVVDFKTIWKNQNISGAWLVQIQKAAELMYKHLTSPERTVENVTQWAKRKTSWEIAQKIPFELDQAFVDELISKRYVETQEQSAVKEQKQINEIHALLTINNYTSDFWQEVYDWGQEENIWNVKDVSFLKLAINMDRGGRIPSDRQAVQILKVLEKARDEGFTK